MGARLISEDTPNKTGELVLNMIFSMIKSHGGWNACVGKGKKSDFLIWQQGLSLPRMGACSICEF
jgi:hypothetical protein